MEGKISSHPFGILGVGVRKWKIVTIYACFAKV
jgi:hypothetical protein